MAGTNNTAALDRLSSPEIGEVRPRMAKAVLRKAEIGKAIERTRTLCQLTLKEFSSAIGRDERQIARWIAGTERPQLDTIFAAEELRDALIQALAEQSDRIQIQTVITIRRTA